MTRREIERVLTGANPVARDRLDGLGLEAMEADLLADVEAGSSPAPGLEAPRPPVRRQRRFLLALGSGALAAVLAAVVLLAGGGSERTSPAYGAELVRFAESTPLLLLEAPGWRVQDVFQIKSPEGLEGSMEFVTGKPIPYESVRVTGSPTEQRAIGMLPPAVRQRRVSLSWSHRGLDSEIERIREGLHPHGRRVVELPVLETTASVDTRAEFYVNQGGPGNREMVALWSEGGYTLRLQAAVPDLAAFEERLGWLSKVDSGTWLDAMPEKIVKAAEHDATVEEMLKGVPVPATFKPSMVPDEGLTTNRYQVGAAVTGTVSCLWFLRWDRARKAGDSAGVTEAVAAMASARRWPILREMAPDGAYPDLIWELGAAVPSGEWIWHGRSRRLLPHAEGLGCARLGIPLLPWKQRLQRERGAPQSP